jgi:hypothetical protein
MLCQVNLGHKIVYKNGYRNARATRITSKRALADMQQITFSLVGSPLTKKC